MRRDAAFGDLMGLGIAAYNAAPTGGRWLARVVGATSQPYRIPERVIAYLRGQARAQGIGDYVSRHGTQIIVAPRGMIVKPGLPYAPPRTVRAHVQAASGPGLEQPHQIGERVFRLERRKPVQVVRHDDPGQRLAVAGAVEVCQRAGDDAGVGKIDEEGLAAMSDSGEQIGVSGS